jgi:hypothetical protein
VRSRSVWSFLTEREASRRGWRVGPEGDVAATVANLARYARQVLDGWHARWTGGDHLQGDMVCADVGGHLRTRAWMRWNHLGVADEKVVALLPGVRRNAGGGEDLRRRHRHQHGQRERGRYGDGEHVQEVRWLTPKLNV